MISYNPKEWFTFIFRFHKADTFRKLFPLFIGICIYSGIIAYLELEYWKLSEKNFVRNLTTMHTLLGFAISMLLVFRTNTAYERWWEGRRLWGSLVNNSRNLAMKLNALLPADATNHRTFFRSMIPLYAKSLHWHLHRDQKQTPPLSEAGLFESADEKMHVPNQAALMMYKQVEQMRHEQLLTGEQLLYINQELMSFTDICGACERIKNTPIPFSYSVFIKKFIFFYVMTLPFGFVFQIGYYVIPVVSFIFYVLASLEVIAEEIEDPFGGDPNDVPTEQLAANIRRHVEELI